MSIKPRASFPLSISMCMSQGQGNVLTHPWDGYQWYTDTCRIVLHSPYSNLVSISNTDLHGNFPLWSGVGIRLLCLCILSLSLFSWRFFAFFWFFMAFTFWRSQSHLCQLFFNLGLFRVSSWFDLGYVIFAKTSYTSDVVPCSVCQMNFFEVQNTRSVKMILILSLPAKNLKSIKKGEAPQKRLWWVKVQQDENAVPGGFQAAPGRRSLQTEADWNCGRVGDFLHVRELESEPWVHRHWGPRGRGVCPGGM